jgi:hypothetical protein
MQSLKDVAEYMDRALASDRGIEITFDTFANMSAFRFRCYSLRKADRKRSEQTIGNPVDPAYSTSSYDILTLRSNLETLTLTIIPSSSLLPPGLIDVKEL